VRGPHATSTDARRDATISGLYDGATTRELDELSIQTAAALIAEEPQYARLAARLLATYIDKEVTQPGDPRVLAVDRAGHERGPDQRAPARLRQPNARKLNDAIDASATARFEYFGLRTLYDRYLLRHPTARGDRDPAAVLHAHRLRAVQTWPKRSSCTGCSPRSSTCRARRRCSTPAPATSSSRRASCSTRRGRLESDLRRATPTSRSCRSSPAASAWPTTACAARGSLIRSTNGHSNGIVPWLKTLDASVAAVNQGGKRKGAACVYLEPWHADIEEFLELRDNTGDEARRTHNLNLANWIPDLFMRRVESDAIWSLFDPKDVPDF
jgi:ribonucleoside-diphosphate reductase alpha chain